MDGGHLIAESLKNAGTKVVFTLCGGHVMNIYDGCIDRSIPVVDVRHEQAAVMAADAVGRLTGEPGVAVVTAGPGVTNAITGLENARRSDTPMVCFGGQGPLENLDKGSLQESDHLGLVASATTWARRVHQTDRLGEYVERAFRQASSLPSGPAYLELPWDVLFGDTAADAPVALRTSAPLSQADPEAIRETIGQLAAAERPVLLVGSGQRSEAPTEALRAFVEHTGIAAYQNGLGRGTFPPGFPHAYAMSRGLALGKADLVINVGAPWDFRLGFGERVASDATIVQVAETAARAGENLACDIPLVGHAGAIARQLAAAAEHETFPDWSVWHAELAEKEQEKETNLRSNAAAAERGVSVLDLADALSPYVEDDCIFIGDGGNVVASAAKVLKPSAPENWLDTGPFGCLGVGPPFALAASIVRPDQDVLVLEGDGSFGLNGFEIETMARQGFGAVFVVGNDAAWSQIRAPQVLYYGEQRSIATGLAYTRYDRIAEGMGAKGVHVTAQKELESALEQAFKDSREGVPVVLNVEVDPATNQGSGSYPA